MIRTIFFDMGGTLDGESHWLERFLALYKSFGLDLARAAIREAFDEAERRAGADESMATADFAQMVALHVQWQLAQLGLTNGRSTSEAPRPGSGGNDARVSQSAVRDAKERPGFPKFAAGIERHLVEGFIAPVREAAAANAPLLELLAERGFILGVISNGCGNVAQLCAEFGYSPFLSLIVDSLRVGVSKPDPAIYSYAVDQIGGDPATMMMVGDSFERDVLPAKKIGMKTAWLEGAEPRPCPEPSRVDLRLRRLADLPIALDDLSPALS